MASLCANAAAAVTVEGVVRDDGAGAFTVDYTVSNGLGVPVEQISLFFPEDAFVPLADASLSAPAGWDGLAFGPAPILGFDDSVADFLALSSGIAPGDSLGGFVVTLTVIGDAFPDPQAFEILDPTTFAVRSSGTAVLTPAMDGGGDIVPLPPAAALFALPALALTARRRFSGRAAS